MRNFEVLIDKIINNKLDLLSSKQTLLLIIIKTNKIANEDSNKTDYNNYRHTSHKQYKTPISKKFKTKNNSSCIGKMNPFEKRNILKKKSTKKHNMKCIQKIIKKVTEVFMTSKFQVIMNRLSKKNKVNIIRMNRTNFLKAYKILHNKITYKLIV